MKTKTKTKSPLPWFGSDASAAEKIARYFDGCAHVTIPFCGGLGILPHLTARSILANDKHLQAINFYRCLKQPETRPPLIARCLATLCHPAELEKAQAIKNTELLEDLQLHISPADAWSFWAMCWLGMKGKGGTGEEGKSMSFRRGAGGGGNATRLKAAAGDLDAWAKEFERVEFTCEDFRNTILKAHDKPENGIYVDAPWVQQGGAYVHRFTEDDHRELAKMLRMFGHAKILVRYGDCQLIRELYCHDHIRRIAEKPTWYFTAASSRNQSNNAVREVWITNRNCP